MHFRLELQWQVFLALRQASCCREQNLLLMGIGIPLPFICFNCGIWKYYSGKLSPSGPPAASTPAPLMLPRLSQQRAHLFPCSCPLQTLFLGLPAASLTATSLWILASPFSQPINLMGAFSTCSQSSFSIPCHEVKNAPAAFEEVQIYLDISPACFLVTGHCLSAKLTSQVLLQSEFWRGSLGLPPSLLCCSAASLCPCKRLLPSTSISPLLCCVSPSAVSSLLNSPLPLLHPPWGQEQVRVTRRR